MKKSASRAWILGMVWLLVGGCAQWSPDPEVETSTFLPPPQRSLDTVVLETVLVRFPKLETAEYQALWSSVDESCFEIELRKKLDQNGLRAGIVIGELPTPLQRQIEAMSDRQNNDALEHAGLAADADNRMRRLQCRAGRRKEVMIRPHVSEPLTVLTTSKGIVRGNTLQEASVLFDLRSRPLGDKRASLQLTPEIKHGGLKQTFISNEYGVRPHTSREVQRWDELAIDAQLDRGEVLMVSSTLPNKALGTAFFTTSTIEDAQEHIVLLIRLSDTPLDELFAPEEIEQAEALMERQ